MKNPWKPLTGILAVLLVGSIVLQAMGLNPFAGLASRIGQGRSEASATELIPLKVAIAGAGSPGSNAPGFGVAMAIGAFEA